MYSLTSMLVGLWLWAAVVPAQAAAPGMGKGYVGSALELDKISGYLTVSYVAEGSSAAQAGIKKGDSVVAIDGSSTHGMHLTQAMHSIEGEVGTTVILTIQRVGSAEARVPVVRRSFVDTYLPAATGGDPRAQFFLGYFYAGGPASDRDYLKAAEWYRKAAEQGYSRAQTNLGYLSEYGLGIPKDLTAAVDWYHKAAMQGDAGAEWSLAACYLHGKGVDQSNVAAFDWYYSSAQHDDPRGEWGLAYMYNRGLSVSQNKIEALKWYEKAQSGLSPKEAAELEATISVLKFETLLGFTNSWDFFMGGCAVFIAITGLLYFRNPEKYAKRVISAREIRRAGILFWLWIAGYAVLYHRQVLTFACIVLIGIAVIWVMEKRASRSRSQS